MPEDGLSVEIVGSAVDASAGGGPAGDPRCRHDAPHERPHREGHARQGHRRCFAGTAADAFERRVRGAEHAPEDAAGAGQLPRRRLGPRRRRTAGARPAARVLRRAVRSRRHAGQRQRRRSSSACRCAPICRRARPTTTSASILRISAPTRCCSARRSRRRRCASSANNQSYEIKGDVKVAGAPAQIEYRRLKGETDAEVKLTATLDEAARTRLGLDVGPALAGPLPMKLTGRVGTDDREGRFNVEADLTNTKIENLLPGWVKAPGRPARAGVHAGQAESRRLALRRCPDRRAGRPRQGHGRTRHQRRAAGGELPGVRHLRRRQGLGAGRPRRRRRAPGGDARRRLRRAQLRQVGDGRSDRSEDQGATSRSRSRHQARRGGGPSTARRSAASIGACRAAAAGFAPSR